MSPPVCCCGDAKVKYNHNKKYIIMHIMHKRETVLNGFRKIVICWTFAQELALELNSHISLLLFSVAVCLSSEKDNGLAYIKDRD